MSVRVNYLSRHYYITTVSKIKCVKVRCLRLGSPVYMRLEN